MKTLEEKGIGRPSTYVPIIETIQSRGYVEKENKAFVPTELGFVIVDLLKEYFPKSWMGLYRADGVPAGRD